MNPHDRKGLLRPGIGSNSSCNRIIINAKQYTLYKKHFMKKKKTKET